MDAAPAGSSGYLTLRAGVEATGEVTDRKSRFIAQLVHVESEAEAAAHLAAVRARHFDARHNVPAWVLASGAERASDDGEPQRTAGLPALEVLRAAGLADVSCVVTRYFGGTLLGPGGLVRAYTAATQAAVASAREQGFIAEMCLVVPVVARVPYALHDRVRALAGRSGAVVRGCDYAADVCFHLAFRAGEETGFLAAVRELASGQELASAGTPHFSEL